MHRGLYTRVFTAVVLLLLTCEWTPVWAAPKPRMLVLTDISPDDHEPDDMESMIRLLVHADQFEIEGLVATTGWSYSTASQESLGLLHKVINAYEQDLPNLMKRSGQTGFLEDESRQEIGYWPSPDYLRSRVMMGSRNRGVRWLGEDNTSPGSQAIIDVANADDARPLWVQAWGGANTLAQAIWSVQQDGSTTGVADFLDKLRVYTITDQDRSYKGGTPFDISAHQWMRRQHDKDLLFIWDECAWKFQNGTGKSKWGEYAKHIQGHGALGSMYPKYRYGVEGDTPAFLYLTPNGLNDPEQPEHGSWGGYFVVGVGPDGVTNAYTNHQQPAYGHCRDHAKHFYDATFNNFAARMDWAHQGAGNRNPVVSINGDQSTRITTVTPAAGTPVTLDASHSHDPDDDDLEYVWWVIPGPGTYDGNIAISGAQSPTATVKTPEDSAGNAFHVICEVTDAGVPPLTCYRRIIFEPR